VGDFYAVFSDELKTLFRVFGVIPQERFSLITILIFGSCTQNPYLTDQILAKKTRI
jgi:hypothetical protein